MEDNISFTWGDKGGTSKTKGAQFYKNFKYDGVTYNLYDNVYLFKDDDPEPHLGKIVSIWELVNGDKKVKIVWLFHPLEICKHLGVYQPSEKEVFLACGEGDVPGVADINPLEAIAGKCRIICTLKDKRNPQPSQADIEKADFVFSRLFDAKKCTLLSDELPATIASKDKLTPEVVPPAVSNGAEENKSASSSSSPIPVPPELNALKISGANGNGLLQEERNSLQIHIPTIREEDDQSNSVQTPVGMHEEKITQLGTLNEGTVAKKARLSDEASGPSKDNKIRKARAEEEELQSRISKKSSSPSRKKGANGVSQPELRPVVSTEALKTGNKVEDQTALPRKRDADGKFKQPVVSTGGLTLEKKAEDQLEEVSRRPVDPYDRSKWFDYSGKTLAEKIQRADRDGQVVLLENFDASLTYLEIEDLILRATQHPCTVTLVTNYMYGDHTYGMGYAFFRSKEATNQVVAQLNKSYLVLPDGRPLLCSKGALQIPRQSTSFLGHLAIEKLKKKMTGEEMKRAVSTAHCSQSNTIEFEMALEWIAAEEKFEKASKRLTMRHKQERERITKK